MPRPGALVAIAAIFCGMFGVAGSFAAPLGTAFTYQGRLADAGAPASGMYDLRFTLFDAVAGGTPVGTPNVLTADATPVSNGVFTVALNFGAAFAGQARWLSIEVKTNLAADYQLMTPRTELTPAPQALYAVRAGSADGVAPGSVTSAGLAPASVTATAISDGAIGPADLSPGLLNGTFWKLGGNTGAGNFLGSVDNQPVEIRANNQAALRVQATAIGPNLVGGNPANRIAPGAGGSFIGSGGQPAAPNLVSNNYAGVVAGYDNVAAGEGSLVGGGAEHEATGDFSVVGGGIRNNAFGVYAAVVGGVENTAAGWDSFVGSGGGNYAGGNYSVVGGGLRNKLTAGAYAFNGGGLENAMRDSADYASIVGGRSNMVSGHAAAIGGGQTNSAAGQSAVIAGGEKNQAWNDLDAIGGGGNNLVSGGASVISGGWFNQVSGLMANVGGGQFNQVAGTSATVAGGGINRATGDFSAIGGGGSNEASARYATVAAGSANKATNDFATVGGGRANVAGGAALSGVFTPINLATYSTVSGGESNRARRPHATISGGSANTVTTRFSYIGGGQGNTIPGIENGQAGTNCCEGASAVIGGGTGNTIRGFWNFNSVVAGGESNTVISPGNGATLGNVASTIGGGSQNIVIAQYATVPGGSRNQAAGNYSFAAGRRAHANHDGSFVWADDTDANFASTTNQQFAVRAGNGVMIQSSATALDLRGGGAVRVAGAGVGTATPVFIHRASASSVSGNVTAIDHPHCNGNPGAILLVTHNYSADTAANRYETEPFGVWYNGSRWTIFHENAAVAMPAGRAFNVMVVKP